VGGSEGEEESCAVGDEEKDLLDSSIILRDGRRMGEVAEMSVRLVGWDSARRVHL